MILTQPDILALVEKPKNKPLLERAREIYVSHRLHLKGEGLQEFLAKIEGYENEDQYSLRKKLANPATVPIYAKETDLMNKVFSAQGFSRYYQFKDSSQEKLSADFIDYLSRDVGDGLSIRQWMRDIWLDKVNFDCTGVTMIELPENQESERPEPYATFRSVMDIHDIKLKGNRVEYIIFKTEVIEKDARYYIYRVVDDASDYIVVAKDGTFKIDDSKTLVNVWGYVPAKVISTQRDSKSKARTSYIWKSVDIANEYLLDSSIHTITKKLHGFPRYWERARGCKKCKNTGSISYLGADKVTPILKTCGDCHGSGQASKADVSDKIIVPTITQQGQPDNVPVGGYIQIDNETTKTQVEFLDRLEKIIHKGVWANKFDEQIRTGEADTATGVMVDVQAVFDKLALMSENAQEVELFIVNAIGEVRYGADYMGSVINYGKKYFVRSADEIERLYATAKKAGLPTAILDAYIEELIYVKFGNDAVELDRQVKLNRLEPFSHLSALEIGEVTVSEDDKILKLYFTDFIERYEQEVKPIALATVAEVRLKLADYVKEKKTSSPDNGGASQVQGDSLGKIPLALQQLALSREREIANGNASLADEISVAMTDLTKKLIEVVK